MTADTDTFVPGAYWTPERARDAVARMRATLVRPDIAAMFEDGPAADGGVPEEMMALAGEQPATAAATLDPARCSYRRAQVGDVPRMMALIAGAHLPPIFIEELLGGFVVAECDGEVIGVAGLELYGESGVIRSVVVDERTRGWGLGRRMSELLIEDARLAGARALYLFTADALSFWQHLGFEQFALEDWPDEPRACWQWQFIARHGDAIQPAPHSMRMRIAPGRGRSLIPQGSP